MTNLFSSFDPRRGWGGLSLNWASLCGPLLLSARFWARKRRVHVSQRKTARVISREVKLVNPSATSPSLPLFLAALFIIIVVNNFLGLFPYVFTATRHLSVTAPLALSLWVGYTFLAAAANPSRFLAHLVPIGTPMPLVPFMVLIEIISSVIRPLTLSVRLAANIIAGHLLLVLTRVGMPTIRSSLLLVALRGLTLLVVLEVAVSWIQGYVFTRLSSLYIREVGAPNL